MTWFTRDWGKVAVVAKGARRLKGPFDAALDLLTVCNIVFIRKSSAGLDILTESQLVQRFKPKPGDLISLYAGYYVAELLDGLSEEYDPHPTLFDEALQALNRLTGETGPVDLKLSLLRFELMILREIGQIPAFDVCVLCGEEISLDTPQKMGFKVSMGGVICPQCLTEENTQHIISGGTVSLLRCLSNESDAAWQRLTATPGQMKEMRGVVTAAIAQPLGRRPKMLRYLPF